jgi:hypothetical protein
MGTSNVTRMFDHKYNNPPFNVPQLKVIPYLTLNSSDPKSIILALNFLQLRFSSIWCSPKETSNSILLYIKEFMYTLCLLTELVTFNSFIYSITEQVYTVSSFISLYYIMKDI